MAMKKTHDAVYAGEKYTDRDGKEKTRYINIGSLFARDDGSLTLKVESLPIGFNGWINFYAPKAKESEQNPLRKPVVQDAPFSDDDMPF